MHHINKIFFFLIYIGWTFTFSVADSFAWQNVKTSGVQIAVGSYVSLGPQHHSMMFRSEDDSVSWSLTGNIPDNTYLGNINCTGKTCIVIAKTESHPDFQPSLLISHDYGKSWSQRTNIVGYPSAVTCTDGLCMMVGSYNHKPMVSFSSDAGESWSAVKNISNLPEDLDGFLTKISCSDSLCAAVGTTSPRFKSDLPNLPIFVISSDRGKTWSFVQDIHDLPSNIKRIDRLNNIKCNNNTCVAAGSYSATYDHWNSHVLLLSSHDKGETWTFIKEIPELEKLGWLLNIEDLIYSNGSFIVVGGYPKDKGFLKSLILVSKDDGLSWSLVKDISGSLSKNVGWLKSVSCNDNTCVAGGVGFYEGGINFGLTLLVSKDNGQSWSLVPYVPGTAYTPDIDIVQCSSNHCIAMGNFSDSTDNSHPVILMSSDKAQSWSVINNIPDFHQVDKVRFSSVENLE